LKNGANPLGSRASAFLHIIIIIGMANKIQKNKERLLKLESEEWRKRNERKKKIPTHPGFPIFVSTYTEDVMKNILDLHSLSRYPLYVLYRVCVREKWLFLVCMRRRDLCGSIADRPQGKCAALNRTRHDMYNDDTLFLQEEKRKLLCCCCSAWSGSKRYATYLVVM
jgi:hypothetical protein